jgi:hypothetical protein
MLDWARNRTALRKSSSNNKGPHPWCGHSTKGRYMSSVTFTPATGGDGSTVDDTSGTFGLAGGGHRTKFIPALTQVVNTAQKAVDASAASLASASAAAVSAASASMAPSTGATSATSVAIGTGSKTFTIETGKNFVIGMNLIIASTANPANNMYGQVTAYTPGSGALVVNVTQVVGSGTIAAWTVSLSGPSLPTVINELKGTTIASASTINLDTASGNFLHVSGATTITAITLASGAERTVVFDGALTLTHNATTLILPGASNILTAAGDTMVVRGDGAGNTRVVTYTRASTLVDAAGGIKAAAIASAATLNLDAVVGDFVHVTGSTTITAITIAAGVEKEVYVDAAPLLTSGANLVLPSGANIQCAAGDVFTVRGDGSGKAIVTKFAKGNGRAVVAAVELLGVATVSSAVASVDFLTLFSSTYDNYTIEVVGLATLSGDSFNVRLANGGIVDTSGIYYGPVADGALTTPVDALAFGTVGSATSAISQTITIRNVNSASKAKSVSSQGSASGMHINRGGYYIGAAVSGFRLYCSGGTTFASGVVRVYGHRNA